MDIGLFLSLALAGIALGNVVFLYLSLIPLFYWIVSLTITRPDGVKVTRDAIPETAVVDEAVGASLSIEADKGIGIVTVADTLPEHFELTDGNNFHVYWKGRAPLREHISYQVRCTQRGFYDIGPASVESLHHSWLEQAKIFLVGEKAKLVVKLKAVSLKKIRDPRLLSKMPVPHGAIARLGMRTSDFLEIRKYAHGDPYRSINWKATARLSSGENTVPMVNEYEKEGKKTVYIFVDAGAWMGLGSNVDNVFEYALQAASGISSFYLERNMRVGIQVYHGDLSVLPDIGRKQEFDIKSGLLGIQVSGDTEPGGLKKAVHECQGHLIGASPLFIIITMINKKNASDLIDGVKSMRWFSPNTKQPQIVVVHITGYELAANGEYESSAAGILELGAMPHMRAVRHAGGFVVPWNPRTQSLSKLMTVGFKRR